MNQQTRIAMYTHEIARASRAIRSLNAQIAWTNVQLFWYSGYIHVALVVALAHAPSPAL